MKLPSVDVAVTSLNAAARDIMEQTNPHGYNSKSKFPPWFCNTLWYYLVKKNYFQRCFKKKQIIFMTESPCTVSLLKALSSLTGLDG
jgi:hypothetical protein